MAHWHFKCFDSSQEFHRMFNGVLSCMTLKHKVKALNPEPVLSAASGNKQTTLYGSYAVVYLCVLVSEHQRDITEHSVSVLSFKTNVLKDCWNAYAPLLISVSGDVNNELHLSGLRRSS